MREEKFEKIDMTLSIENLENPYADSGMISSLNMRLERVEKKIEEIKK